MFFWSKLQLRVTASYFIQYTGISKTLKVTVTQNIFWTIISEYVWPCLLNSTIGQPYNQVPNKIPRVSILSKGKSRFEILEFLISGCPVQILQNSYYYFWFSYPLSGIEIYSHTHTYLVGLKWKDINV